mmetsp:Transcript_7606/g.9663  ORF Transcript_7606/g.9663 Transcript_7606/m.9663 type:complete len:101 (+) Transcript_7606:106-408(+)|eukprot:CAMPEP_0204896166 /NCGR_PEP_ID=MMETSP1349-20130617/34484_1 /ASSEMBLY_ACC=CAM_ASM_000710 /TAXON_ID=215587 /ORGANISM="Aplanochytrium stocchinoi, Strain GSBS06" /LENGTH=100 /DNA_ID=CAMNT_0052063731 /DNA_START=66 /DNA_END=368 /DNA_ORIENTATION=+
MKVCNRENRDERVEVVLAQLDQWVLVAKRQFGECSPEFKSVKYVHQHALEEIDHAMGYIFEDLEDVEDTEALETTFTKRENDDIEVNSDIIHTDKKVCIS